MEEWQKTGGKRRLPNEKKKPKNHETDFLLYWRRRFRSHGDSLSAYPKAVWAVNHQQPEITIHISIPDAQRVEGWVRKLLGVDYVCVDSTPCSRWPQPLEWALIRGSPKVQAGAISDAGAACGSPAAAARASGLRLLWVRVPG